MSLTLNRSSLIWKLKQTVHNTTSMFTENINMFSVRRFICRGNFTM